MRIVIQRVSEASCTVENKLISKINQGFLLLIGFSDEDYGLNLEKIAKKIINMRIFSDECGKLNLSIKDISGSILAISQFTLYADIKKGNRPSFVKAMKYDDANEYYLRFVEILNKDVLTLRGEFGADMKISLLNDGPVTIILDSKDLEG